MLKSRAQKATNGELKERIENNVYGLFITTSGVSKMYGTFKDVNKITETIKILSRQGQYKDSKFEIVILPAKELIG